MEQLFLLVIVVVTRKNILMIPISEEQKDLKNLMKGNIILLIEETAMKEEIREIGKDLRVGMVEDMIESVVEVQVIQVVVVEIEDAREVIATTKSIEATTEIGLLQERIRVTMKVKIQAKNKICF